MSLETYKHKRDFRQTGEPSGNFDPAAEGHAYLIQKHEARRLHYDFRLQIGGVLKSWAVPKGPSLDPKDKRLAVETEDHPLEYADFEGVIPAENYGAGTVMLWDRGEWQPDKDPEKSYRAGKISFELQGERLRGRWTLVKMRGARSSGKEWLLVKEDDEFAQPGSDPTAEFDVSVASDRSMPAIAREDAAVHAEDSQQSASSTGRNTKAKAEVSDPVDQQLDQIQDPRSDQQLARDTRRSIAVHELPAVRQAPFPTSLKPQLATLYKEVPTKGDWLHEIKYDGYRLLIHKQDRVRLLTRNGKDWTNKFPVIEKALAALPECIIDGELVYLDEQGISNFESLQSVLKSGDARSLAFYAFDLPYLQGYDLTKVPLIQRKQLLAGLIDDLAHDRVLFSSHIEGEGAEVIDHACQHGLEGIISKERNSTYTSTRAKTWRKIKCSKRQEFVIVGYTAPSGSRESFGALLLGYYDTSAPGTADDKSLKYAGKVGTGFTDKQLRELHQRLEKLRRKQPPLVEASGEKHVTWVKPELVAEVEFTEWTAGNRLRHPAFIDLRADKPATEIVREVPEDETGDAAKKDSASASASVSTDGSGTSEAKKTGTKAPAKAQSANTRGRVAGVDITSPDKILYANAGLTKQDLAEYYAAVGDYILPFIAKRPLTLVRCPRGHTRNCFFQKHLGDTFIEAVKPVSIPEKKGESSYAYIDSVEGLIGLVQMGTLEIHAWGSRIDDVEKPDQVVFDLDPDPDVDWQDVKYAVLDVGDFLQDIGLQSFVRTSGGKGLHVVVPLQRRHTWDDVKDFAKAVAQAMAEREPERYVATMSKAKRKGKIFIDYLRNSRGATSICNYSTRSRAYAPVATPLAWEELEGLQAPDAFRVENIMQRLQESVGAPWPDYHKVRQSITQPMRRRLQLE